MSHYPGPQARGDSWRDIAIGQEVSRYPRPQAQRDLRRDVAMHINQKCTAQRERRHGRQHGQLWYRRLRYRRLQARRWRRPRPRRRCARHDPRCITAECPALELRVTLESAVVVRRTSSSIWRPCTGRRACASRAGSSGSPQTTDPMIRSLRDFWSRWGRSLAHARGLGDLATPSETCRRSKPQWKACPAGRLYGISRRFSGP